MKAILSFLLFSLPIASFFIFGLYSYWTILAIFLSSLVTALLLGREKKERPFQIILVGESLVFCVIVWLRKNDTPDVIFPEAFFSLS